VRRLGENDDEIAGGERGRVREMMREGERVGQGEGDRKGIGKVREDKIAGERNSERGERGRKNRRKNEREERGSKSEIESKRDGGRVREDE
jgi:hypothetical protein